MPKKRKKSKFFVRFPTNPVATTNMLVVVKTVLALKNPISLPSISVKVTFIPNPKHSRHRAQ
jgi:hypothetical protein